jgi:hypothetical protein
MTLFILRVVQPIDDEKTIVISDAAHAQALVDTGDFEYASEEDAETARAMIAAKDGAVTVAPPAKSPKETAAEKKQAAAKTARLKKEAEKQVEVDNDGGRAE